jgi:hypothetical protein
MIEKPQALRSLQAVCCTKKKKPQKKKKKTKQKKHKKKQKHTNFSSVAPAADEQC